MPDREPPRTSLTQILESLWGESIRSAQAELALSRAELLQITRGYVIGAIFGVMGLVVLIIALFIAAQACATALSLHFESIVVGYFAMAAILLVAAILLIFVGKHVMQVKHKPVGLIFKWLFSADNLR